jgi:hypothetical protein
MEQITRTTHYPLAKSQTSALLLAPCLLTVLTLIVSFTLIIISIRMLPQKAALPDPFVSLAEIFAEQSQSELQARGFLCSTTDNYKAPVQQTLCRFHPEVGTFSMIGIAFVDGNLHNHFVLVRNGALTVGDLVNLWGRPNIHKHDFGGQLDWLDNGVIAVTVSYQGCYSLFLPVRSIVFMSTGAIEP